MSTLKQRISEAASIFSPYCKSPEEVIIAALQEIGIDDSEIGIKILEAPSTVADDFNAVLVKQDINIPLPRVKAVWIMLKGQDPFKQKEVNVDKNDMTIHTPALVEEIVKRLEKQKPIGQWSDQELLQNYGRDCPLQVEEELAKRSKGRPCITFLHGEIHLETSLELLRQARHVNTPTTYYIGCETVKVYKVGDFPMSMFYECPTHSHVLLVNGYCEECGLVFKDYEVNKEKYIFIRLISETDKLQPVALRAYLDSSIEELKRMFPKIALKYNDLKEEGRLPTMKRRLSNTKEGDPFRVVHKQY